MITGKVTEKKKERKRKTKNITASSQKDMRKSISPELIENTKELTGMEKYRKRCSASHVSVNVSAPTLVISSCADKLACLLHSVLDAKITALM